MTIASNMLYLALVCYGVGTAAALLALVVKAKRLEHAGMLAMVAGFAAHTVWIGSICVRTGHPPLTNLSEIASFVGWTVFLIELLLWIRYRVYAASFFVHPLVLSLLAISAIAGESFRVLDPELRSNVFTVHLLFSAVGVAGLMVGLAFGLLAMLQDRALKRKTRGRLWDWIPSLDVCKMVSYRALAIGFSVYTLGLLAGIFWSYRTTAELIDLQVKQVGAVVAWILFAVILQSYINDTYRRNRTLVISGAAFLSLVIAMLGIRL
jgi:ABC-type uncharacterized transport system permease subunit